MPNAPAIDTASWQAAILRGLVDSAPSALTYWDAELRCVFTNRTYLDWIGKTSEQIVGRTRQEFSGRSTPDMLDHRLAEAVQGQPSRFEFSMATGDGSHRHFEVHCKPFQVSPDIPQGAVVMSFDITARLDAERSLAKARDEAHRANLAKSAFLANISHEIRTPMNAIVGLTHLVRRGMPGGADHDRMRRIADAAGHLLSLIDGVLDLSRIESGKLELDVTDLDLDELMMRAMSLVMESAREKGLELVLDSDHVPEILRGDAVRLSQVLVNLLGNAVKFTRAGSVVLRARIASTERPGLLTLRFTVADTGSGIAPDTLAKLFKPFEQGDASTTRRFGGTGLGLTITRHIARLMGGDAGADSVVGAGSEFWLEVVLALGGARPEEAVQAPSQRLLVLDDQRVTREALRGMLGHLGHHVETAATAAEATASIVSADSSGHPYDTILVDMEMPGTDGLAFIQALRAADIAPTTNKVIMTAAVTPHLLDAIKRLGIHELLVKPMSRAALHRALASQVQAQEPGRDGTASADPEAALKGRFDGTRVLLAEDNPVNQEVAVALLEAVGLAVDVAPNGAVAVAKAGMTDYALILMDMQMPVLDGPDAARQLRQEPRTRQVPIIAMTANAYAEDRQACVDAGMNDFLSKPVDPAALYKLLLRWLDETDAASVGLP